MIFSVFYGRYGWLLDFFSFEECTLRVDGVLVDLFEKLLGEYLEDRLHYMCGWLLGMKGLILVFEKLKILICNFYMYYKGRNQ